MVHTGNKYIIFAMVKGSNADQRYKHVNTGLWNCVQSLIDAYCCSPAGSGYFYSERESGAAYLLIYNGMQLRLHVTMRGDIIYSHRCLLAFRGSQPVL